MPFTTPDSLEYPSSSGHTRLWEHLQTLADTVQAALTSLRGSTGNSGAVTVSTNSTGNCTISHGLGVMPTAVQLTMTISGTPAARIPMHYDAATTSSVIGVVVFDHDGTRAASVSVKIQWWAKG